MVASNSTQDAPPLHTTRQMLDDLDRLMERMLSVPVGDAEPPAPKLAATLTLFEAPTPAPAPKLTERVSPLPLPKPIAPAKAIEPPAAAAPVVAALEKPSQELAPITNVVVPTSVLPEVTRLLADVPEPSPSPLGLLYTPLWLINVAYDGCTYLLGRPGAFLRDAGGRLIVGLLGVVLGILAAGWYAKDWFGWTW